MTKYGAAAYSEIVPKPALTFVARTFYNGNYVTMPTSHRIVESGAGISVSYNWGPRSASHSLDVQARDEPVTLIREGTEEEFIAEHYWGYAVRRDGGTLEYEVEHSRWRTWRVDSAQLNCDVERLYGSEFADSIGAIPDSALLADGSHVLVRRGIRI